MATKSELEEAGKKATKTKVKKVKITPVPAPESKPVKLTFSVKVEFETLAQWRAYSAMEGYGDLGNMTGKAIQEYMKNHPIPNDQKARYESRYSMELESIKFSKEYQKLTGKE